MLSLATGSHRMSEAPIGRKEIPMPVREAGMRRTLRITPVSKDDYWIGIARTQEDLRAAFSVLHDSYVGQGIMDPHPSGLRCNLYQALPYTTTVIAKYRGRVVGTLALIKDSPLGFPSDKSFKKENDFYRQKNYRMAEASALAVHKDFRGYGHQVSLPLMKYLILYAIRHMDVTMLIATVHPRSRDFYGGLLNFHQNGEIVKYTFAKGALATHLTMDTRSLESWMEKTYRDLPVSSNFHWYIFEFDDPVLNFPERPKETALDFVMTPELLRYFFVEQTDVFKAAAPNELGSVHAAYSPFFDLSRVPFVGQALPNKDFRYMTRIPAVWMTESRVVLGTIYDLTGGGAFFSTEENVPDGGKGELVFNMGSRLFRISSQIAWANGLSRLHYPRGYGMRFLGSRPELVNLLVIGDQDELHEARQAEVISLDVAREARRKKIA